MQKLFLFLLSFALIVPALSASEYEITFPILLSTDSIVSNDGSVTTEPYKPVLFDSILQFASLDPEISYVCMNTKQDHQVFTDILQMLSYQRPGPMIDRGSERVIEKKLLSGSIDGSGELLRFFQSKLDRPYNLFIHPNCNTGARLIKPGVYKKDDFIFGNFKKGDTLTYRIQYPVGTKITARKFSRTPLVSHTITSNYQTLFGNTTDKLFINWSKLVCPPYNDSKPYGAVCIKNTYTATLLSGKKIDLRPLWDKYQEEFPPDEYFPLPTDIATLSIKLNEFYPR